MKFNSALLLVSLAIFCLVASTNAKDDEKDEKKDTLFSRLLQRRVDRTQKLLEILQDREKSLTGKLRDAIKERIQRVRDRLNKLLGRDKKDKDDELAISDEFQDEKDLLARRRLNRIREAIVRITTKLEDNSLSKLVRDNLTARLANARRILELVTQKQSRN